MASKVPVYTPAPGAVEEVQNSKCKRSSLNSALLVLSSASVILVAFRNDWIWYLQHFWSSSGDFLQRQWSKICGFFGPEECAIRLWGTLLLVFVIYWTAGLCYTMVDLTGKPAFVLRYKIQDTASYPVPVHRVLSAIYQVVINQTLVAIPFGIVTYNLMVWIGYDSGETLPTFQRVFFELVCFLVVEEIGFYYSHRLLHHPRIYKYIHKRHHDWISPIAITALYCHPVEHIFANLLPVFTGPLILGSHTATMWLWVSISNLNTLNAHSGFHFPLCPSPEAHDFHHLKFNENYGVLGILDWLHGTDSTFRKSKAYERNITLLSLVPVKQLYPDDPKKK